jgi:hypothetical protein
LSIFIAYYDKYFSNYLRNGVSITPDEYEMRSDYSILEKIAHLINDNIEFFERKAERIQIERATKFL